MTAEAWITIGAFVAAQLISFGVFVMAIKGDTTMLKAQMVEVQGTLKDLGTVLIGLAEARGRMDRLDDRLMTQGKRLDELATRVYRDS